MRRKDNNNSHKLNIFCTLTIIIKCYLFNSMHCWTDFCLNDLNFTNIEISVKIIAIKGQWVLNVCKYWFQGSCPSAVAPLPTPPLLAELFIFLQLKNQCFSAFWCQLNKVFLEWISCHNKHLSPEPLINYNNRKIECLLMDFPSTSAPTQSSAGNE